MKISIITVAYNSEKTIARTIESVLNQSCNERLRERKNPGNELLERKNPENGLLERTPVSSPVVEYLIIDGASVDGTVAVAEKYRSQMEEAGIVYRIISEPDHGIYDAMNKGIRLAGGDIIGILNSDDWYEPDALETVNRTFADEGCDLMFANIRMHRQDGSTFIKKARQRHFQTSRDWNHPTTFVKAGLCREHPFRDLGIHDDYGFYLQMRKLGIQIVTVDRVLANFQMGGVSNHWSFREATKRIRDRYQYCYRINGYSRWYLVECVVIELGKMLVA